MNDYAFQRALGTGTKFPKWAIAFKFSSKFAVSTLLGIDVQVLLFPLLVVFIMYRRLDVPEC